MATTIQKAIKGNRTALLELYDSNKKTAYYLSCALMQNDASHSITIYQNYTHIL